MTQRLNEPLGCLPEAARSRPPTNGRLTGNAGAATPIADQPSFRLKLAVCASNRVWCDAEIVGQLTHRRQRCIRRQLAAFDCRTDLLEDLLVWRDLEAGVDDEVGRAHVTGMRCRKTLALQRIVARKTMEIVNGAQST